MADDLEEPDVVETPQIDAGRALGVSGRGNLTPRGQDVQPSTGVLRPIDPMKPASFQPAAVKRSGGREVLDPSSIQTTGKLARTAPGDYDNTAARERWKAKRPFTSDRQLPEYMRPEYDAPTDRQIAEQRHAEVEARRQTAADAKEQREQAKLATETENSSLEADFRGSGKQFYTDPLTKRLTPIIDKDSGRELYHATDWTAGTRADGKTPAMVKRNKFGETEYKEPKIVHNPDLSDDQLYYDMGDQQIAAGKVDDLINHPDFAVAKQARTARRLRTAAMWKEASAGAQEEADMASAELKTAQEQDIGMQQEMEKLSTQLNALESNPAIKQTEGGFLGIGAHPASAAQPLLAMKQQLQTKMDALGTQQAALASQISPRGELAQNARMKTLSVGILRAKAKHVEYSQLADDRRAILRQQGIPEASDANLQSILRAQAVFGGETQKQTSTFQRELVGAAPFEAKPAAANNPATALPTDDSYEPAEEKKRGIKNIGAVGIDEFARRYGDGSGPAKPDDVIKLYRRSKDIESTLNNSDTTANPTLRDQFAKEKEYIDSIAAKRILRLPQDQAQRVVDVTRDPTWWDAVKGIGKSAAGEAASGAGAVLKGLAQVSEKIGPLANPETGEINQEQEALFRARQNETAQQKMERIKGSPEYQLGNLIQDAASKTFAKNPHEDEGAVSQALNAAAGAAGGFAPLVASGPMAPVTIGLQTAGQEMQRIYDEQIQKGVDPETAADVAQTRALASGAVQAALFEILPKPLQKAGNRLIVDKIAGGAFKKFIAGRAAQATEGAVLGGASTATGNVASGRPVGEGVAEGAEGLGIAQAVMPRGPSEGKKSGKPRPPEANGGEPAPSPEPPAPVSTEQSAIDRINQGIRDDASKKSAAESAKILDPGLEERTANTPPPGKSAAESAAVFDDVATTEEAGGKVGSQQEAKAQRLVDEVAAATGRPREEILATRQGKEATEWTKDLEYKKDPIRVDPDRRITELKSDLDKLDAEWKQHVDRTGAEASRARATDEWQNGIRERAAQRQADQQGTADRRAQRAGDVEAALSDAERTRRSPKSTEGLRKDLTAQSQPTTREAQLMARRGAIESELVKAERLRQSPKGGEALRSDLETQAGRKSDTAATVDRMDAEEFRKWAHDAEGGQTGESHRVGIEAIGDETKINALKESHEKAKADYYRARDQAKALTGPEGEKADNAAHSLAAKVQFFSEAISAAENTGSVEHAPEVQSAHLLRGDNFEKAWREQGGRGGSENQVVFKAGRVYKRNYNHKLGIAVPNYGTLKAFDEHIDLHNELFPSAKITREGTSNTSDGPAPVISQAEIKGEPASAKEIRDYMAERGFQPTGGDRFVNDEKGIEVSDLRDGNVLKDAKGVLHVIDPVVKRTREGGSAAEKKTSPTAPTPPTTPSVKAESAGAATEVGSPATKTVDKPEPAGKPKGPSRADIARQRKVVRDLTARIDQLAEKYPDRASDLQKRGTEEREKLAQMEADKQAGSAPSVGNAPNGEPDLITQVADTVGTLATEGKDSDDVASSLSRGAARLLRSKNGYNAADAVDDINRATGRNFRDKNQLLDALAKAADERIRMTASMKVQAYEQKVNEKVLGGKNPKSNGSMPIEELGVGASFKVDGEKFSVIDVEETPSGTWEYVVKDGVKFRVPEGTRVFPDARSIRGKSNKAGDVEFIPDENAKKSPGELIPDEESGFNLASDEQKEAKAPEAEGTKTDEMFGSEARSTPPTEMDKRNAAAREMTTPVSEHVESHTPETLEGEKLNRNWTAFADDAGSLKVPRAEMPQIKSEHRGALVNFLKARGISAEMQTVEPSSLKPTQAEYSPAKVEKAKNFEGSERPILVSEDGHVVDGHHQWLAALQKGDPIGVIKLNGPIDRVLADMKQFPSVEKSEGARTAAKLATPTDKIIGKLESLKISKPGMLQAGNPLTVAWDSAIDFAILGVRTGRAVADMVRMAVERFKKSYPQHTAEDVTKLEEAIHSAASAPASEEKTRMRPSKLPESLKEAGAPVKPIDYEQRGQDARKAEAAEIIKREGAEKAEDLMANSDLPGDTRVAIGGNLIADRMIALQSAKPGEIAAITKDIQRITARMQPELATEAGQQISMFNGIYQDARVASAMEYVRSVKKKQTEQLGPEGQQAAQEAAKILNGKQTPADKSAAIERLKKKFSTKPATRMLNELQRIDKVKELNRLGVLTADDLIDVAGNAIGIPGVEQKKLQHLAELADRIENAENHAQRSRAELELADTLNIYKGVNPMDLEASILTLNILSGYTTQLANLTGNFLQSVNMLGTTAVVNPGKVPEIVRGMISGFPEGLKQAGAIMATGRGTRDFTDKTMGSGSALATIDYSRDFGVPTIPGAVLTKRARALDKIGRFMKAADATFYYPAREAYARLATAKLLEGKYEGAELRRKIDETLHVTPAAFEAAKAQATQEGYQGIDLARRTSDIIEESRKQTPEGKAAAEQSEQFAAESTYNNEPVGFAGFIYRSLANMVQHGRMAGIPVLKPWMMFLRVPTNVFNATMNFTPLGAIRAKKGMQGETPGSRVNFTADQRNRMYVQSLIGSTMMAGLIHRVLNDQDVDISAAGPDDGNHRRQMQASGWLPYGVKLGNKWYSYRDSPLLVPLAIIGHVADSVKFQKSKSDMALENKVVDAVAAAPQIIFQTSMLSGLADLMGSLGGKGSPAAGAGRTLGSIPANLVIPYNRLLQQIDQTFDNQTYKNDPVTGSVPFLRRTGTPETDVQGRPNLYDPLRRFGSEEKNDPVDTMLRSKNVFIPEVGKTQKLGNGVMTDEQRERMRTFSGQRIRVRLRASIPQLRAMNQENAQKLVNKISEEERNAARRMISIRPASP